MAESKEPGEAGHGQKRSAQSRRSTSNQAFTKGVLDATGLPDNPNLNYLKQATSLTPTDLAVIAANIGTGLDNPDHLAVRALSLWESCARAIVNWPALKLAQICAT